MGVKSLLSAAEVELFNMGKQSVDRMELWRRTGCGLANRRQKRSWAPTAQTQEASKDGRQKRWSRELS